jgi:hypothetical protein
MRSLAALLPLLLSAAGPPPGLADGMERLRSLYVAAVEEEAAIDRGLAEVAALRARPGTASGSDDAATLAAYEGALVTLRAKHATWPPARLRYLRRGFAVLDSVVAAHPDHAEARYLRLMSGYYLPGILGRGGAVREDFAAVARLLPAVRSRYPDEVYREIAGFLLENGPLPAADRRELERSLEAGGS